ncbi:PREDICTED: trihelix transcription factor PTL-like [Ipomoea nil]|uniref:trihelix transcription factor PTL-like n=1 Tax=Ipomoea nil TaxID=35883 RepID=UPI00090175C9|nr:PREDICTED: trihelix transcription factor PTL-like [Ipomoea nil]
MEDQYGMADLRNFINNRPLYTSTPHPQPPEFLSPHHRNLAPPPPPSHHPYEMVMPPVPPHPRGFHHDFLPDCSTNNAATTTASVITGGGASSAAFSGLEMDAAGGGLGCDGGNGRWPRQETLTLLEIRSRLDPKFKEANQKGPLWDEVSRIMCEEHGYQRSGKKCREKFENLYKYYKKTKEGKAGRQDGKHYRFFRQLEALYGEPSNNSGSVSETHHAGTGSFPYNNAAVGGNNNNTTTQDAAAFHHHHHQDSKVSDSLSLSNSSDYETTSSEDDESDLQGGGGGMASKKRKGKGRWKAKIKDFIDGQMRKLMEKQEAWLDKIMKTIENKEEERMLREDEWRKQEASRMEREQKFWANERAWIEARDSALMEALHKVTGNECNKKRKDDEENNNIGSCYSFQNNINGGSYCPEQPQPNDNHHHPINPAINDSCFRLLMGDNADNLWENYGLKLSNGGGDDEK